jgi:hypothetical protein
MPCVVVARLGKMKTVKTMQNQNGITNASMSAKTLSF